MGTFWQSVRTAYSGWWTLLGLVAASISGFNLLRKVLEIGLSRAMTAIVEAYTAIVHPPVLALAGYLGLAPPPAWVIDVGVFWLLIGGIILRSAWAIRATTIADGVRMGGRSKFWSMLMQSRVALPLFVIVVLLAWPYAAWMLLSAPHVIRYKKSRSLAPRDTNASLPRGSEYLYDMRVVVATHAMTAIVCILAWAMLNVLLT